LSGGLSGKSSRASTELSGVTEDEKFTLLGRDVTLGLLLFTLFLSGLGWVRVANSRPYDSPPRRMQWLDAGGKPYREQVDTGGTFIFFQTFQTGPYLYSGVTIGEHSQPAIAVLEPRIGQARLFPTPTFAGVGN
jgi:hypothetical protein